MEDQFATCDGQSVSVIEFQGNEVLIAFKDGEEKYVNVEEINLVAEEEL